MARPRSQDFDEQYEFILQQAALLFARSGYLGASMNEVAEACSLSKPAVYHYFKDKGDLLLSIAEKHMSALVDMLRDIENQPQLSGEERLRELIVCFLRTCHNGPNEHRVLTEDVRFLPEDKRMQVLEKERYFVRAFARAIVEARPELAGRGLESALTMLLFGMINSMFTWFKPDGRLTHASVAPIVVELFIGGLQHIAAKPELLAP